MAQTEGQGGGRAEKAERETGQTQDLAGRGGAEDGSAQEGGGGAPCA